MRIYNTAVFQNCHAVPESEKAVIYRMLYVTKIRRVCGGYELCFEEQGVTTKNVGLDSHMRLRLL